MPRKGYDYSWSRPNLTQLRADGGDFVIRYVSWDTHGKNLTGKETAALGKAGFQIVTNWEYNSMSMAEGYQRGLAEAHEAIRQAMDAGQPTNRPIYYSADWNVQPRDLRQIDEYLRAAAVVHGGHHNVGLYGGITAINYAYVNELAGFLWQTPAWSNGERHHGANLYQDRLDVSIAGGQVDVDLALTPDFGQWDAPGAVKVPPYPGRLLTYRPPDGYTRGTDVRMWQSRMAERGWNIEADGVYGRFSKGACMSFQEEKHLLIDGIVGPITWYATWELPVT
jgi:hypothetical protein